jgi:hypothetical protein
MVPQLLAPHEQPPQLPFSTNCCPAPAKKVEHADDGAVTSFWPPFFELFESVYTGE